MLSLRFADGCIFQNNIKNYHISMNQQIIVEPLFWLDIEEDMVPINNTSHAEWESCKNVKDHCSLYNKLGCPCKFGEVYLYQGNLKIDNNAWNLDKITWKDSKIYYRYSS